jgi:hypothetical protein
VLFVYDCTNWQSFENIRKIWYPLVKSNENNMSKIYCNNFCNIIVLFLIGTNSQDLEKNEVPLEKIHLYGKEINAISFLIGYKISSELCVLNK